MSKSPSLTYLLAFSSPYPEEVGAFIGKSTEPSLRSRRGLGVAAAVLALAVATVILIWAVAVPVGPEVCALTYPGPRNCFTVDRISAAIVWTTVLGVLSIALLLVFILGRTRRPAVIVSALVLVAVASACSYVAVAWIPALA